MNGFVLAGGLVFLSFASFVEYARYRTGREYVLPPALMAWLVFAFLWIALSCVVAEITS